MDEVTIGDTLVVFPHEICPVDGNVVEGHGVMDESYLTGEPYVMSKTPGSGVLSGAINGEAALTIRADKRAIDSRYAKIMVVMRESEQNQPHLRRLGDQLGAIYTPVAVTIAVVAWIVSAVFGPHSTPVGMFTFWLTTAAAMSSRARLRVASSEGSSWIRTAYFCAP